MWGQYPKFVSKNGSTGCKDLSDIGAAATEDTMPEAMFAGGLTDAVAVPTSVSIADATHQAQKAEQDFGQKEVGCERPLMRLESKHVCRVAGLANPVRS